MANRNTLHISKLEDFKKYLDKNGIAYRPGKGPYQVLIAGGMVIRINFTGGEYMCDIVGCNENSIYIGPMGDWFCQDCKQREIDEGAEESEFELIEDVKEPTNQQEQLSSSPECAWSGCGGECNNDGKCKY